MMMIRQTDAGNELLRSAREGRGTRGEGLTPEGETGCFEMHFWWHAGANQVPDARRSSTKFGMIENPTREMPCF